jgi:hypothetical protein
MSFNLEVGDTIGCEELKEKESFIWKNLYGKQAWEKEQVRLKHVSKWLDTYIKGIVVKITGFGAGSSEIIKEHPKDKGEPDIQVLSGKTDKVLMYLEVTGTERKVGNDYWLRPDKIEYAVNHPEKDVWFALHYADDQKIIWIKPSLEKKYPYIEKNLKGAIEHFVIFDDNSPEVKTSQEFKDYLDFKVSK